MEYKFKTVGTCAREVSFEVVDGKVYNIQFLGGCHGNTQGVSALAEGREGEEIIRLLDGINCRGRGTSCPDQLSKALKKI